MIGVRSARAEAVLRDVYAGLLAAGAPLVVTDFATAELVKVAANAFLATKISSINAMAEACEVAGADVTMRVGGAGLRPPHRRRRHARRPWLRRRLPAQGHPRLPDPGRELARRRCRSWATVDDINPRRRARMVDWPAS